MVPSYLKAALRYLKPPDEMSVSEWAAEFRYLGSKESALPGRWKNSVAPYMVAVMNELTRYETEETILCTAVQMAKTEAMNNMIGYCIQQDPGPILVVYPKQELAESISENRILPMILSTPTLRELYEPFYSQKLELQFEGLTLALTGSNSPAGLASRPVRYVFMDEVDKFPGASKKESEPISLARMRTTTYGNGRGRKIVLASTPTIKTGQIWKALMSADQVKHFFVPCPHCGQMIELLWSQMRWPEPEEGSEDSITLSEQADGAAYICQECSGIITEAHKPEMLQAGEWRVVTERNPVHRKVAYWIPSLYSPFVTFSELVLEYLEAKGDPEQEQNFVNSRLAEPWEDTQVKTSADDVLARRTELPEFVIPEWAQILTGGVDVQETSLYYTIRAWGDYSTSQCIAYGQVDSWAEIERVMNIPYPKEDGGEMLVELCLIDSGFNSDATYNFCAEHADWAAPVKGSSNPNMINDYKLSQVNRPGSKAMGMNLVLVNGDTYKSRIASRIKKENGRGSWMVHKDCDREYAEQVTAEHRVTERSASRTVTRWKLKHSHAANHYLDCEVYAYVAAHMRGLRMLHLQRPQMAVAAHNAEAPAPARPADDGSDWFDLESGWVGDTANWLGG